MSAETINLLTGTYRQVADVLGWEKAYEFGRRVWEERRSPSRLASEKGRGGTIYIPKALNDRVGGALLALLPVEDAKKLVCVFGGSHLEFGKPCQIGPSRDQAIADSIRDGWSVQHVAVLFDLNEKTVRRICDERGVSAKDSLPDMRAKRAWRRDGVRKAVIEAYLAGESVELAAYDWGFAPDVAHAILRGDPPVMKRRGRHQRALNR